MMRIVLAVLLMGSALAGPAFALTTETATTTVMSQLPAEDQDAPNSFYFFANEIDKYIDHPKGTLDWHLLAKTREINEEGKTPDGLDYQYFRPEFTPEVKALNGKAATIKGFMFPLDEAEDQTLFLIGPFPLSCPFQYHVGPALVVEIHTDSGKPVKFSYDPVTVTGTFEVVPKDMENSTFYRLKNARLVR